MEGTCDHPSSNVKFSNTPSNYPNGKRVRNAALLLSSLNSKPSPSFVSSRAESKLVAILPARCLDSPGWRLFRSNKTITTRANVGPSHASASVLRLKITVSTVARVYDPRRRAVPSRSNASTAFPCETEISLPWMIRGTSK